MRIRFHKSFDKKYTKLRPHEKKRVKERLYIFSENPFDPTLQNHTLKGKYIGYRSVNITSDLRALYKLVDDSTVIFVDIDTHSNLYS